MIQSKFYARLKRKNRKTFKIYWFNISSFKKTSCKQKFFKTLLLYGFFESIQEERNLFLRKRFPWVAFIYNAPYLNKNRKKTHEELLKLIESPPTRPD